MNITFYNNKSPKNKIGKELEVIGTVQGEIKGDCNLLSPEFLIAETNFSILNANYFYIDYFNRYYFMKAPIATIGSTHNYIVIGEIDPLKTYEQAILSTKQHIVRASYAKKITMYPDSLVPITPKKNITLYQITPPDGTQYFTIQDDVIKTSYPYVLNVAGTAGQLNT